MNVVNKVLLSSVVLMTSAYAFAEENNAIYRAEVDEDGELVLKKWVEPKREQPKLFYVERVSEDEEEPSQLEGYELYLGAGISSVDQHGSYTVSAGETASLEQSDEGDWGHWTVKLGGGYEFLLKEDENEVEDEIVWFPAITPQLNLYFLGGSDIEGEVYTFNPTVNAQSYSMDFSSTRLMADVAFTVASYEQVSLYVLGGLGVAWNNTSLTTVPYPDYAVYGVDTPKHTTTAFAYEFGAGFDFTIDEDWALSLEYLFTGLGDAEIRGDTVICTNCGGEDVRTIGIESSDVEVNVQTILLGLTYAL